MEITIDKEVAVEVMDAIVRMTVNSGGRPFKIRGKSVTYSVIPRLARVVVGRYVRSEVITYTFPESVVGLEVSSVTMVVRMDKGPAVELAVSRDGVVRVFPPIEGSKIREFLSTILNYGKSGDN